MSDNQNKPREYDAVKGGQNSIPVNAAVLGGIAGVKRRLASSAIEVRIAALSEAPKYGEAGLDLILGALQDKSMQVKSAAFLLLKDRDEENIKQCLQNHFPLFGFYVITVDADGQKNSRRKSFARFFPEDLGNGIVLEMVYIPGGTFMMGSPNDEAGREDDESPQHQVTVPAFYAGKYPITQAQWEAVMGNNPSYLKGEKLPVECVSWYDAVEFCEKLSETTGKTYRLLSEAEWEYACRAGTTTPFHFGETITPELVNYITESNEPTDVGSFPPNAFGLYDMHGNVEEWCSDKWLDNYDGAPTDGSSWESGNNCRMLRGGSWANDPSNCRSAVRSCEQPIYGERFNGFRVACVAAQPPTPNKIIADEKLSPAETFQFEVITLYQWGRIVKTEQRQAEYFSENLGRGVSLEMVKIPGGTFTMGPPDIYTVSGDRIPQYRVTVPTFYAGKYAITQEQWEAVMRNNPSCFKGEKRPVENVSWYDAVKFCEKLSQTTRKTYRLLSEAEWEYACRAGTTTAFHFGETCHCISPEVVNYDTNYSTDVGSFPPNAFGLYDMHGNVWEWCSDKWHDNYDAARTDGSSWETGTNNHRLMRGGSFYSDFNCQSATRDHSAPNDVCWARGFRVACVAA
ncbi:MULTISPECIES: SUMF1/EgtB/PvdO family nonheme iron enzyme [unclassified Microcoleus]|uniref:SUMF1/EgtB/PvdO family nonheme iron enzyme n=1 Tax=unclassified Microcoleus TaxID=2642155 RepID=UPI0025DB1417|nr:MULTISPECIES: SUMF1/EgtB/PvdO family nonheme iron enzyme [unclassified Microcoleus]